MEPSTILAALAALLSACALFGVLLALGRLARLSRQLEESQRNLRQEVNAASLAAMRTTGELLSDNLSAQLTQQEKRLSSFTVETENRLDAMRIAVERRLAFLQQENSQKLDEMRQVVDEKLQKTMEERLSKSFGLVSDRLEQVYKGLGEMQTLAGGVGDLKKVLSNVKSRGILGEVQLEGILREILAPEQYGKNVVTKAGSRLFVEFAVRLPNEDGSHTLLPIDAKFPGDSYAALQDAYELGDPALVQAAANQLQTRLRQEAKDIRDKYLDPPATTEFGVLFLPFEGLYAEVVNRGMVESLQRDYRVIIAGPSTMAALLNSLQMGFRAFALQRRTSEVWEVLGAVKTEFDRFAQVLATTQNRIEQASTELDKLVGVRTRQIQRRLQSVTSTFTPPEAEVILQAPVGFIGGEEEDFSDGE